MARILVNLLSYTGLKGGMERATRELYREFGRRDTGHEFVGFASKECMKLDQSWFPGEIVPSGISGENRLTWALGELFAVGRAASKVGADLVHSPATLGPWRTRMPAVYTMHDMLYFSLPHLMTVRAYNKPVQWMEKAAASNATRIMTDSAVSKQEIIRYLRFPADRIDVVHLGATPPATLPEPAPKRERALFLATGQRLKHKNFDGLIRALATIDEAQRPQLVVTGSFKEDPLIPLVADLGVGEWVDLRGWVPQEELDWLTHHATALVVPGIHDGFSLPMLEAMLAGLPILSSNAAVFQEVGGDAAIYFDPADSASIAGALLNAVAYPERLSEVARKGRERAGMFTWGRVADDVLEVFEQAIAHPRR